MDNLERINIVLQDGNDIEVTIITSFCSDDETKRYVMYTKGEEQNGNTVVYVSIARLENEKLYLDEITDDAEWTAIKIKITKLLAGK